MIPALFTVLSLLAASAVASPLANGRCGADFGDMLCPDNKCCSQFGYCGSSSDYCAPTSCQSGYGSCNQLGNDLVPSPNGQCGFASGFTCEGSFFGNCTLIAG